MENIKFIYVEDASKILNLTPQTIRKYIKCGILDGVKISKRYYIPCDAIDRALKGGDKCKQ